MYWFECFGWKMVIFQKYAVQHLHLHQHQYNSDLVAHFVTVIQLIHFNTKNIYLIVCLLKQQQYVKVTLFSNC